MDEVQLCAQVLCLEEMVGLAGGARIETQAPAPADTGRSRRGCRPPPRGARRTTRDRLTGSGKTTLLNALIELLPDDERSAAIEDTLELRIDRPNCVRFEARGLAHGAVSIRDLVRHALRHRPNHIVAGEARGGEAADLLQALNTRHGGSLTAAHANNAESALSRLTSCAMLGTRDHAGVSWTRSRQ